jgi:hypothetical protein
MVQGQVLMSYSLKLNYGFKSNNSKAVNPTSLPIRPILESGLILYSRIYSNGKRTVTIEDSSIEFQPKYYTYAGTAQSFTAALLQSLKNYHMENSMVNVKNYATNYRFPPYALKLHAETDKRLQDNMCHLRAMSIEDNTILVTLEGYSDIKDLRTRIFVEGIGKSFYNALSDALRQFEEREQKI